MMEDKRKTHQIAIVEKKKDQDKKIDKIEEIKEESILTENRKIFSEIKKNLLRKKRRNFFYQWQKGKN